MIAPERPSRQKREAFEGYNYAHRGLHTVDKTVPENSLPAFEAAAKIGYGIELDVRLSADGKLVVFHDDDCLRMCGVDKRVEDMPYSELRELRLGGTSEHIPLFSEVLDLVAGRSLLLVELKHSATQLEELCEVTLEHLQGYEGRYCVESFDPFILAWFRKRAPHIMRGQLAALPKEMAKETTKFNAILIGNLFSNFMARPNFIAYKLGKKPLSVRLAERMGAMKFAWTSVQWIDEQAHDGVIFQYYRPRVRYK